VAHNITLGPQLASLPKGPFELGKVTNATGQTYDVNVESLLTDALTIKLSNQGLLWTEGPDPKVLLSCQVVEYDEGSAFKRWLLPGWGATVLAIQCDMKDKERQIGSLDARRTVSAGGAYTTGANLYIFQQVAEDVVQDLRSKMLSPPA
jgi:hypothetical protein